jgi:hypothetical protein
VPGAAATTAAGASGEPGGPRAGRRAAAALAAVLLCAGAGAGAAAAQTVTLALAQYEELRARAKMVPEPAAAPPAPFALASDELEIVAGPASARIVQTLAVRLLAADWQSIPIGDAGSLVSADLGGLEGRVTAAGATSAKGSAGGSVLQVRGQGEYRVRLESAVPVARDETATRPAWRFALRLPAAAVARGWLRLAPALAGGVEEAVLGAGGLIEGGRQNDAWRFAATPGGELEVRLLGRAVLPERALLPLRFEATTATAAVLSRTRLEVHAWVVARVAQGRLAELRLLLPDGFTVLKLSPPEAAWKAEGGVLTVTPLMPVEETLALAVELTAPPRDAFAAPLLVPQGAVRTTLLARAALRGDGLLPLVDHGSSRSPDGVEVAPLAADPAVVSGKLYLVADPSRPPRWQAEWAERTEVLAAQIDGLWVELSAGEAGRAGYQLWAAVRNHGATELSLALPAGFELVVASRDGVPLAPGLGKDQSLSVPLLSREAPQLIHVAGVMPFSLPRDAGQLPVPLPATSLPAARLRVRLLLPGDRSYALVDATRAAATEVPPRPAVAALPPQPAPGDLAGQLLLRPAESLTVDVAAPSPAPAGCVVVAAAWSAMSSNPAPLLLQVASRKEKESWF